MISLALAATLFASPGASGLEWRSADASQVVCRTLSGRRYCRTQAEWDAAGREAEVATGAASSDEIDVIAFERWRSLKAELEAGRGTDPLTRLATSYRLTGQPCESRLTTVMSGQGPSTETTEEVSWGRLLAAPRNGLN